MNLSEFFTENPQAAIAFSGGVDSAYLLYAALQCRAEVRDIPVIQFKADPQRRDARHTHCHDIQYHEHDPSLCQLWIDTIQ